MKKVLIYTTLVFVLIGIVFFKTLIVYTLETSLTWLLETPVKVKEFKLSTLELYASIKDNDNNAYVKINTLYPLQADVTYTGNADAFKVYQPVKAESKLTGTVYYKNSLVVKAKLLALGATSAVEVNEYLDDWEVLVTVRDLNLSQLQRENNRTENISGLVNADVNYHTDKDSLIKLSSDALTIEDEVLKSVEVQISEVKDNVYSWAIFNAKDIEYKGIWFNYDEKKKSFEGKVDLIHVLHDNGVVIDLKGEHNDTKLKADVNLQIVDSKIEIADIIYDLNSSDTTASMSINLKNIQKYTSIQKLLKQKLSGNFKAKANFAYINKKIKADLNTKSFGGDLNLAYDKKTLTWKAKEISLAKVLSYIAIKENIHTKIISEGSLKENMLHASLKTKELLVNGSKLENIDLSAEGKLEELKLKLSLESEYAQLKSSTIKLKDFDQLTVDANLTTPYTKAEVTVNAKASIKEKTVDLNASSSEFKLHIFKTTYLQNILNGEYTATLNPSISSLVNPLALEGRFSYKDVFSIFAKSRYFGGITELGMQGKNIYMNASNLETHKLLKAVKQPLYADGKMNIQAKGTFDKLSFTLSSEHMHLNKKYAKVDENLSFNFKGSVDKNELKIKPILKNRHMKIFRGDIQYSFKEPKLELKIPFYIYNKGKRSELFVQSDVSFDKVTKANLNIKHKWDNFIFNNITYEDKKLRMDFDLDIDDLSEYQEVSAQELYGPFKIKGQLSKKDKINLVMNTSSLGGTIKMTLQDKDLHIDVNEVEAIKIGRLLKKKGSSKTGTLNGEIAYNLEKKHGFTRLRAEDIEAQGVDIDKSLKELKDALGLNIFAMGNTMFKKRFSKGKDENLTTQISSMEFDVDISPEFIISKDIAMATEHSRFAVDMKLKHNGDIKDFEVAILDYQGCAIIKQKLKGNISDPKLENTTGSAVVIIGKSPEEILKTGGKIISVGAGLVDSAASFIWKKGLRQSSDVTLVEDTLSKGGNIFSSGKDMVVRGKCDAFYTGAVKHPGFKIENKE